MGITGNDLVPAIVITDANTALIVWTALQERETALAIRAGAAAMAGNTATTRMLMDAAVSVGHVKTLAWDAYTEITQSNAGAHAESSLHPPYSANH